MTKPKESTLNYCERDARGHHFWQLLGVDGMTIYYKCSQCQKCKRERIDFVKGGYDTR